MVVGERKTARMVRYLGDFSPERLGRTHKKSCDETGRQLFMAKAA